MVKTKSRKSRIDQYFSRAIHVGKNLTLSQTIFLLSWEITLSASLVESLTYSGFIAKHLKINFFFFFYATIILGVLLIIFHGYGGKIIPKILQQINKNIFFAFIASYLLFEFLELVTYDNFVFSKFHIIPANLLWPILTSSYLILVSVVESGIIANSFRFRLLFFAIIFWVLGTNLLKLNSMFNSEFAFIIRHPLANYDDKMRQKVGQQFYDYTQFVIRNSPENSNILVPPQAFPWPQSGNIAYVRYFIYPRGLFNGEEYESGIDMRKENIDYVMLNWGDTDPVASGYTHDWPKFDVSAEKIILMGTGGNTEEVSGDYIYKNYKGKKVWGLIKVKK